MAVTLPKEITKEALLQEAYQLGFAYERDFGNCCQCCVAAATEVFGLDPGLVQPGHLFGGGFASCGRGVCGALSGAAIVLGSLYGRYRESFGQFEGDGGASLLREVMAKFEAHYGSIICREVQTQIMGRAFDIRDPEDFVLFEASGAHTDKCTDVVGATARWLAEAIWDAEQLG